MHFGTKYQNLEEPVAILEKRLGISFNKRDDSETGVSYDWATAADERGFSYFGIGIRPTRMFDPEAGRMELRWRNWRTYTFVIDVSDELVDKIASIRDLVTRGLLEAEEIRTS